MLAAFLPIIFWPGVVGDFMRYLPVIVFAIQAGSLVYALFFAPVLGSVFGKSNMDLQTQQYLGQLENGDRFPSAGLPASMRACSTR